MLNWNSDIKKYFWGLAGNAKEEDRYVWNILKFMIKTDERKYID